MVDSDSYRRKFLVLVDESKESERAVTFAAHRVKRTGGTVVLLAMIETQDFSQFLGVEEVMRAEAREAAERMLEARRARHRHSGARGGQRQGRAGTNDHRVRVEIGDFDAARADHDHSQFDDRRADHRGDLTPQTLPIAPGDRI